MNKQEKCQVLVTIVKLVILCEYNFDNLYAHQISKVIEFLCLENNLSISMDIFSLNTRVLVEYIYSR